MSANFISIFLCLLSFNGNSQATKLTLYVQNETGESIPFASVAILNRESGTVANELGIALLNADKRDSLIVSSISYKQNVLAVSNLNEFDTIILTQQAKYLDPVVVYKNKLIGKHKIVRYEIGKANSIFRLKEGSQIACYFSNNLERKCLLESVSFKLDEVRNSNTHLRLRFLYPDSNGKPGIDILNNNLIIEPNNLKKINKINLSEHTIRFPDNGLFVVLEWLDIESHAGQVSTPVIKAGFTHLPNLVWLNYRDRKWSEKPSTKLMSDKFMIPAIELEIKY